MNENMLSPSLSMDETWTVFDGVTSDTIVFAEKFIPEIYLRPEVHPDIKESFRIIRKLLEHSYYEYKFYDIAALKSMITMEMALKIRYEEINGFKWDKKKNLEKLFDWFVRRKYFEVYNSDYLDSLRKIRNLMAHPYQHNYSGPSSSHLIENIVDLVNGLYEDPALRLQRMRTTQHIINLLNSFNEGVKVINSEQSYMVHRAWPGFLNNKGNSEILYFYYKPCFQLPDEYFENNQWGVSPTELFTADSFIINRDSLLLKNTNGQELLVEGLTDEQEKEAFRLWKDKYEKFTQPTGDYLFTHTSITDTFLMHLRAFHKI